jgi:hypothetical protein
MSLNTLPGHSRLWLLALQSAPDPQTEHRLRQGLDEIVGQWRHKGQAYRGAVELLEPQLIAVAEPQLATQPSGCAIDGMLLRIRRLTDRLGLALVDPAQAVLVRLDGRLVVLAKADLATHLEDGTLGPETPVLDLSLYSLNDLRAGQLERPLAATWIARRHPLAASG